MRETLDLLNIQALQIAVDKNHSFTVQVVVMAEDKVTHCTFHFTFFNIWRVEPTGLKI